MVFIPWRVDYGVYRNTDLMSARLRDLTESWQTLNDIARDRHLLLQSSLQVVTYTHTLVTTE